MNCLRKKAMNKGGRGKQREIWKKAKNRIKLKTNKKKSGESIWEKAKKIMKNVHKKKKKIYERIKMKWKEKKIK